MIRKTIGKAFGPNLIGQKNPAVKNRPDPAPASPEADAKGPPSAPPSAEAPARAAPAGQGSPGMGSPGQNAAGGASTGSAQSAPAAGAAGGAGAVGQAFIKQAPGKSPPAAAGGSPPSHAPAPKAPDALPEPSRDGRHRSAYPAMDHGISRVHQVHKIFRDLHDFFTRLPQARGGAVGRGGASSASAAWELTPPRARPEGLEFNVKSGSYSCRFIDNMNGMIWKVRERSGRGASYDVLTLHPDEEGLPRLIEKPIPAAGDGPGSPHGDAAQSSRRGGRTAFQFTSIPQVAQSVLEEIHAASADTPAGGATPSGARASGDSSWRFTS